jgi:hypothetical protein
MKPVYILLITSLIFLPGCSDFLNETDPSNFMQNSYFKTAGQAQSAVNAIYADLRYSAGGDYGGNPYFMTDFQTGLAGTRVGQNMHINKIRTLTNDADNQYSKSWWDIPYRAIANANLAITHIPSIPMDETQKSRLLGEAFFLRAYNYFNLVRLFGSVPLVLVPVDASSPELYPEQASAETVYGSIVSDLLEAERSALPWTDESGRATMTAVKSLLAGVYLTMAGYPLQKGSEYYALAAGKAKEVIDRGSCRLFPAYSDMRDPSQENRGEFIFMIQYHEGISENPLQEFYLPYNLDISYYSTEPGTIYATEEFIAAHEEGDRRIREKEFYYTSFTSNANRSQTVEFGFYHIFKFFDMDAHLHTSRSSLNYPLMRYADVVLTFAEAQNESGTASEEAYYWLNQIRRRAELNELSGLSREQFREAVWKQRYFELAFENKIWFDMARTRKALNLETGTFDDYVGHRFSYGPRLTARELLFPIPTSEKTNNTKLKQNEGY